ncbi:bifunctional oligoribonuclease/PAP phosphatase NrnA [Dactylosporangium vinaceum]|uniref:Bifunctional oligoribonuclease/PAP phosphatase NrnA n=1 Tax=Dactylosporangium vinaceum TaxID=53362 RepID=A0ABV5M036_9ACTN|nr:bifunctional oligoribonuclease/PAP phosphatase NrnA [Dactylosporangium vinaceum]UAB98138.1 bifunctional oligoribonuclease/PAP phosphatase NrnA [Dactylosporangium vinaceum]
MSDAAAAPLPPEAEWAAAVAALRALPRGARVLLACHVNPDGDALGSMLGCGLGLRAVADELGIGRLTATFPGPLVLPAPFDTLPGTDLLVAEEDADPAPDAMLVFDVASSERLGGLADRLRTAPVGIVLDHHVSNPGFGRINLVDPTAAATSVLSDGLLRRLGVPLDPAIAECLYVALSTDTGSFKFASTTPAVHEFAARLIAAGIQVGEISRRLFDTRPIGALRLFGVALARMVLERAGAGGLGFAWTYLTLDELAAHDQKPAAVEALIDTVRSVAEADVACLVKPVRPGEWSVSLRSKGAVDVSAVAVALGGGGHRFAAGFSATGRVEDVVDAVRTLLPAPSDVRVNSGRTSGP